MSDDLLRDLLRQVSRSFYLSLAILPTALREPIALAYLLARAADSVADTRLIAREDRLTHLQTLRQAYAGEPTDVAAVGRACAPHRPHGAERRLLERVDEAVARLERLPSEDRGLVRGVLATLTSGMVFDLTRFPGEDADAVAALRPILNRSIPNGGDWSTVNVASVDADHQYEQRAIAGYRQIVDLSPSNDSRYMDAVGQSGHFLSQHYDDFIKPWQAVDHRPMRMDRMQIDAGAIGTLTLVPRQP